MAASKRSHEGYAIAPDGTLTWVPPGWGHTPAHALSPPACPINEREFYRHAHAARIAAGVGLPSDWPPFLLSYHCNRLPNPWRRVEVVDGKRDSISWHPSREAAIAFIPARL